MEKPNPMKQTRKMPKQVAKDNVSIEESEPPPVSSGHFGKSPILKPSLRYLLQPFADVSQTTSLFAHLHGQ
uniref:Uncharacterized protein n=1 Tax=Panagrolaimus sp. JU765 TaxID=591449 RepID=A0AC34QNK6_9BILA